MTIPHENPFAFQTPETLSSDKMVDFFVQEFSDFPQVEKPGHTMIFGPRGTGKSTILRYMEPDCQVKANKCDLSECQYFAVSVPLKSTVNLPEFDRLEITGHGSKIISEHALVCEVLGKFLFSLNERLNKDEIFNKSIEYLDEIRDFLLLLPNDYVEKINKLKSTGELLELLKKLHDELRKANKSYLTDTSFSNEVLPYKGPIVGYNDFLKPLLSVFRKFKWMPQGPIYLLFDDAEQLGELQTRILNSWIAQRSTNDICIKVTAQENKYKTFESVSGIRIESPHDYSNIVIHTVRTAKGSEYEKHVRAIIERRLEFYKIDASPEDFFPQNAKQIERLEKIKQRILEGETTGYRPGDDAYRYTRPELFKELAGTSKQSSKYSYSGFGQLVNISDGLLRDFLEAASQMYAESNSNCTFIEPKIQNEIIRRQAKDFLSIEFGKLEVKKEDTELSKSDQLLNLINAMGGLFRRILLSDGKERRIICIAFSDGPDDEIKEIIQLGVEHRYFKLSTIGNKEGTGRVPLLVLSRMLAPYFNLDPNGFAGYKFLKNEVIKQSLTDPNFLLNKVRATLKKNPEDNLESILETQGGLFDDQ